MEDSFPEKDLYEGSSGKAYHTEATESVTESYLNTSEEATVSEPYVTPSQEGSSLHTENIIMDTSAEASRDGYAELKYGNTKPTRPVESLFADYSPSDQPSCYRNNTEHTVKEQQCSIDASTPQDEMKSLQIIDVDTVNKISTVGLYLPQQPISDLKDLNAEKDQLATIDISLVSVETVGIFHASDGNNKIDSVMYGLCEAGGGYVKSYSSDESFESCVDEPCSEEQFDKSLGEEPPTYTQEGATSDSNEEINKYSEFVSREVLLEVLEIVKEKTQTDAQSGVQSEVPCTEKQIIKAENVHAECSKQQTMIPETKTYCPIKALKKKEEKSTQSESDASSLVSVTQLPLSESCCSRTPLGDKFDSNSPNSANLDTDYLLNETSDADPLLNENLVVLHTITDKIEKTFAQSGVQVEIQPIEKPCTEKELIIDGKVQETEISKTKKATRRSRKKRSKKEEGATESNTSPLVSKTYTHSSLSEIFSNSPLGERNDTSLPHLDTSGSVSMLNLSFHGKSLLSENLETGPMLNVKQETDEEQIHFLLQAENPCTEPEQGELNANRALVSPVGVESPAKHAACICQLLIQVFHEGCRFHWTGGQGTTRLSFLDHLFVIKDRVYQVQEEYGTESPFMCPMHGVLPDCVQNSRCDLCSDSTDYLKSSSSSVTDGSAIFQVSSPESKSKSASPSEVKSNISACQYGFNEDASWKIRGSRSVPFENTTTNSDMNRIKDNEPISTAGAVGGIDVLSPEDREKRKVLNKASKKFGKLKRNVDKALESWSVETQDMQNLDTAADACVDKAKERLNQQLDLVVGLLQQQHTILMDELEIAQKAYTDKFKKAKKKIQKYETALIKVQKKVQKNVNAIVVDKNIEVAKSQKITNVSSRFNAVLNTKPILDVYHLSVNMTMPDVLTDDIRDLLGYFNISSKPESPQRSKPEPKSKPKIKQVTKEHFTPPLWPGFERKPDGSSAPVKSTFTTHSMTVSSSGHNGKTLGASAEKKVETKKQHVATKTVKPPAVKEKKPQPAAAHQKLQAGTVNQQKGTIGKETAQQKLQAAKLAKKSTEIQQIAGQPVKNIPSNSGQKIAPMTPSPGKNQNTASASKQAGTIQNVHSTVIKRFPGSEESKSYSQVASEIKMLPPGSVRVFDPADILALNWVSMSPEPLLNDIGPGTAGMPSEAVVVKKKKSKKKKAAAVELAADEDDFSSSSLTVFNTPKSVCAMAAPRKIKVRGKEATGFAPRLGGEVWMVYGFRDPHIDLICQDGNILETTRIGGNAMHAAGFNDDHILVSFNSPCCQLKLLDVNKEPRETFKLPFPPTGLGVGSTGIVTSSRKALYWIPLDGDVDEWIVKQEGSPLMDVCSCDVLIMPQGKEIVCAADKGGQQVVFYEKANDGKFVALTPFTNSSTETEEVKPPGFTPVCVSAHTSGLLAILDSAKQKVLIADLTEGYCRVISIIDERQLCHGVPSVVTFALNSYEEDPKLWVSSNDGYVYLSTLLFLY